MTLTRWTLQSDSKKGEKTQARDLKKKFNSSTASKSRPFIMAFDINFFLLFLEESEIALKM